MAESAYVSLNQCTAYAGPYIDWGEMGECVVVLWQSVQAFHVFLLLCEMIAASTPSGYGYWTLYMG